MTGWESYGFEPQEGCQSAHVLPQEVTCPGPSLGAGSAYVEACPGLLLSTWGWGTPLLLAREPCISPWEPRQGHEIFTILRAQHEDKGPITAECLWPPLIAHSAWTVSRGPRVTRHCTMHRAPEPHMPRNTVR